MKAKLVGVLILVLILCSCCQKESKSSVTNILFLHHSTGEVIWRGDANAVLIRFANKISKKKSFGELPALFKKYNRKHDTNYHVEELIFPKESPYGWNNFPYDYYNIWVKHAGDKPYLEEPTLEELTKNYQAIIFKHCFPVSNIQEDLVSADINSDKKTISNYKLQYLALREKLHEFPETKFVLFVGPVQVESRINDSEAKRAKDFFNWVIEEWDIPNDNIFLWNLYRLQTNGGLYVKDEYAVSQDNSHPNKRFASMAVKLLFNRIIDVIESDGKKSYLSGEEK